MFILIPKKKTELLTGLHKTEPNKASYNLMTFNRTTKSIKTELNFFELTETFFVFVFSSIKRNLNYSNYHPYNWTEIYFGYNLVEPNRIFSHPNQILCGFNSVPKSDISKPNRSKFPNAPFFVFLADDVIVTMTTQRSSSSGDQVIHLISNSIWVFYQSSISLPRICFYFDSGVCCLEYFIITWSPLVFFRMRSWRASFLPLCVTWNHGLLANFFSWIRKYCLLVWVW